MAFFPREAALAASGSPTAAPQATPDQKSELDKFMSTAQRVPLVVPAEDIFALLMTQAPNQRIFFRNLFRHLVYAAVD